MTTTGGSSTRRTPRVDPQWQARRPTSRQQVKQLAEPPAVVAARMLRTVHAAYRAARAEAKNTTTVELEVEERRYRSSSWLLRVERAEYRAVREELRARGIEAPPVPDFARRRRLRRAIR